MAASARLKAHSPGALVRMAAPEWDELRLLLFKRYPTKEWATFARFGWRETAGGLVLTLSALDAPGEGDLDPTVGNVAFQEPYTLRIALNAERHPLAVGVVHSHPEECAPRPSSIDDDMDAYYSRYFCDFAPDRPYLSLIIAIAGGELTASGRIWWHDAWHVVGRFAIELTPVRTWVAGNRPSDTTPTPARVARLASAFGDEALARLRRSTVAVIGAGGTGSAAIETLARAGVGHLIIVDPDTLEESNLERVHGSLPSDCERHMSKAAVALKHIRSIDPTITVEAYRAALPQGLIVDTAVRADVVLGCTDQQHSRLAISDLALRYLVPAIDCGVALEGRAGTVTGQVMQFVRFLAADPCALCRQMVTPVILAQELMSSDERAQRRAAAEHARAEGEGAEPYWLDMPQLNTVGYLTTAAGSLAAGYAIGWLTGRVAAPFSRVQRITVGRFVDTADDDQPVRPSCSCRRVRGWADQGQADALVTAPAHWPPPEQLQAEK